MNDHEVFDNKMHEEDVSWKIVNFLRDAEQCRLTFTM
jgi:hypothetical protein